MRKRKRHTRCVLHCCAAQEEGIMVKRLDSTWKYGERSEAWIKFKPDYVQMQVRAAATALPN
jgi:ATP-dependent DNA ligase